MARAEIALVCGLKVRVGCQDRLWVISDADETLAKSETRYVSEVLPHNCEKFIIKYCKLNYKLLQLNYIENNCMLQKSGI